MHEPQLLYEQGVLAMRQGDPYAALTPLKNALAADPAQAQFWLAYAAALLAAGEATAAVPILKEGAQRGLKGPAFDALTAQFAIADSDAAYEAASALHQHRQWAAAIRAYGLVIAANPVHLAAHANLGNARLSLGNAEGAEAAFRQALTLAPDDPELHQRLGDALGLQNLPQDAEAEYRRVLALKPDHAAAYTSLATVLFAAGRIPEAFAAFSEHAARFPAAPETAPHKTRHDQEQQDYLKDVASGQQLGAAIAGKALQEGNRQAAARSWKDSRPQIVVIDDFLTAEALEKLRLFCWGADVWRRVYDDGYLGAMPEQGFACPLLAQVAEELPNAYPEIFERLPLRYLWGFKYDSSLKGINIHADKAAVNVNFWITPDSANRDPQHGGLVVWDRAAPLDWEPDQYNGDIAASRAYLARMGAKPVTIPYRANRAVIFDSDLFHETDKIDFAPGYLNRRINITLLYGDRKPGGD
jgi:tetratricopeptide (TPR) repeat protein